MCENCENAEAGREYQSKERENRYKIAKYNFRYGLQSGIPPCCVLQFTFDSWKRSSLNLDGINRTAESHYVPCTIHEILYLTKLVKPKPLIKCAYKD